MRAIFFTVIPVKGYFLIEALIATTLFSYLFFLSSFRVAVPRETAELCQDIAQVVSYGFNFNETVPGYVYWIGEERVGDCEHWFRYCTVRYVPSRGEVKICAAECSHP